MVIIILGTIRLPGGYDVAYAIAIVCMNAFNRAVIAVTRTGIFLTFQRYVHLNGLDQVGGEHLYHGIGLIIQAGSFVGAMAFFALVNFTPFYQS